MAKRVAITIAGAVSLGSYEAGVLYELLEAIRANNANADEDHKIYIDVLTGASAGGMTAAMVAQALMYNAAALQGETSNMLYQAWVEKISLLRLARMHWKERKWHSLFSSDLIESIGRDMLITPMQNPGSGPHPAVEQVNGVPQKLRVGLALTNLNGIDYLIRIVGLKEDGFNYTTSLDQKLFDITADGRTDTVKWQQLCAAAVGSGAFPVAFRPKAILHAVEEYGDPLPQDPSQWEEGKTYVDWRAKTFPAEFAHSDGGILQNQPLGIAKNLVDLAVIEREQRIGPAAHCDNVDRLYAFVSPRAVKSSAQNLTAARITICDELKQLFRVYTRQAAFHDWITAEQMNQRIRRLDERATQLSNAIKDGKIDMDALATSSANLNALLVPDLQGRLARLARLREQYGAEYKVVADAKGGAAAETFISALATLETAAHLEKRDKMRIIAVLADAQNELAGAGFAAFLGFFRKAYRQHDYWVGRVKAREYLCRPDVKGILGVTMWPEEQTTWTIPLHNPTKIGPPLLTNSKLKLNPFALLASAVAPLLVMLLIRPVLLVILLVLASVFCGIGLELARHFHL